MAGTKHGPSPILVSSWRTWKAPTLLAGTYHDRSTWENRQFLKVTHAPAL